MELIKVNITSEDKTKSHVLIYLLKHHLRTLGFDVDFDGKEDFVSENDFDSVISKKIDGFKLTTITEKTKIKIR